MLQMHSPTVPFPHQNRWKFIYFPVDNVSILRLSHTNPMNRTRKTWTEEIDERFLQAILEGNLEQVKNYAEKGADLYQTDEEGLLFHYSSDAQKDEETLLDWLPLDLTLRSWNISLRRSMALPRLFLTPQACWSRQGCQSSAHGHHGDCKAQRNVYLLNWTRWKHKSVCSMSRSC